MYAKVTPFVFISILMGRRPAEPPPPCPPDMVHVPSVAACVDRYEWPNVAGEAPAVALTAVQSVWDRKRGDDVHNAEALCASVGKRLCTMEEWTAGCRGPRGSDYPFGRKLPDVKRHQDAPCNYGRPYRERKDVDRVFKRDPKYLADLYQADLSGERGCVSESGAEDMMGNVEEWITCPDWMSRSKANCTRRCADGRERCARSQTVIDKCYCLAGRYWSAPVKCGEIIAGHSPEWHDYETGTRCCRDAATP